jgi:hypothetical protein
MNTITLEQEMRQKICSQIELQPEGLDRYRVISPFMFDDGDHLVIVLKKVVNQWLLTDEGHTYMHLTYDLEEKDLRHGSRQSIIAQALSMFSVSDRDGELILEVPPDAFGDALYSFIQALLRICDVTYLNRELVYSTFIEDFRSFTEKSVPAERREFNWHHPQLDPIANYPVDLRINGTETPVFVYAINNDNKARDVTISLLKFELWKLQYHSISIFENQEDINRQVLARLSDVCEKQFSSLDVNKDRITQYLSAMMVI